MTVQLSDLVEPDDLAKIVRLLVYIAVTAPDEQVSITTRVAASLALALFAGAHDVDEGEDEDEGPGAPLVEISREELVAYIAKLEAERADGQS